MSRVKTRLFGDPDTDLIELLAREFEVDYVLARSYARKNSWNTFTEGYHTLVNIVGEGAAKSIVTGGEFAQYRNGSQRAYIQLARAAVARLNRGPLDQHLTLFNSLDSLQNFLTPSQEDMVLAEDDDFNVGLYRILHKANPQSVRYLDSLIEQGTLEVKDHEHWHVGKLENGPRGNNILKKIKHQLTQACGKLGLGRPALEINYGTSTLAVDECTQETLRTLRERVYSEQNSGASSA